MKLNLPDGERRVPPLLPKHGFHYNCNCSLTLSDSGDSCTLMKVGWRLSSLLGLDISNRIETLAFFPSKHCQYVVPNISAHHIQQEFFTFLNYIFLLTCKARTRLRQLLRIIEQFFPVAAASTTGVQCTLSYRSDLRTVRRGLKINFLEYSTKFEPVSRDTQGLRKSKTNSPPPSLHGNSPRRVRKSDTLKVPRRRLCKKSPGKEGEAWNR